MQESVGLPTCLAWWVAVLENVEGASLISWVLAMQSGLLPESMQSR